MMSSSAKGLRLVQVVVNAEGVGSLTFCFIVFFPSLASCGQALTQEAFVAETKCYNQVLYIQNINLSHLEYHRDFLHKYFTFYYCVVLT